MKTSNNLKTTTFSLLTTLTLTTLPLLFPAIAKAIDQEEVPVEKVFVPAHGYDDNDNVVIRVEGTLPDPCYVLGNTEIKALADNMFEVHQYAWRRDKGVCSGSDDLYESSFSEDVSLGRLNLGEYKIVQHPADDKTTFRPFSVAKAKMNTLDDFNYANVSQVSVPDVIPAGQERKGNHQRNPVFIL